MLIDPLEPFRHKDGMIGITRPNILMGISNHCQKMFSLGISNQSKRNWQKLTVPIMVCDSAMRCLQY